MYRDVGQRVRQFRNNGHTLVEALVVLAIAGMIVSMAVPALYESTENLRFKKEIERFIYVLKLAHNAAAESTQRYYVMINLEEGFYRLGTLPVMPLDVFTDKAQLKEYLQENSDLIENQYFPERIYIDDLVFDDGTDPIEEGLSEALLFAGRNGWSNAVKILFSDEEGNQYSVLTNRLNSDIEFVEGDAYLPEPMLDDEVRF